MLEKRKVLKKKRNTIFSRIKISASLSLTANIIEYAKS